MPRPTTFNRVEYKDPRDDLLERTKKAEEIGDTYVAIPVELARALQYRPRECSARTIVNGDRFTKTLIEVKCTKTVDPETGRHIGMHSNGKTNWE